MFCCFVAKAQSSCDNDDDTECMKVGGCDPEPRDSFNIPRVHAVDPNDIIGPTGYGDPQWMSVNDQFGYTIRFENDPDFATAPAQIVRINCPIDNTLNIYSFRLSDFGFGAFTFQVPDNSTFYSERLDVIDSLGVYVDVTAGIDITKNEVFWIFESIDPLTGLAPEDAFTGFLPVNDSTVTIYTDTTTQQGEGFVSFTIYPANAAITGDTVSEQASIVFDQNAAIPTNIWTNIIDAFGPASTMDTVPEIISGDTLTLCWSAVDDPGGVGEHLYDLYLSKDNGPFYLYEPDIDSTCYFFTGDEGSAYAFYVRAKDYVGNEEDFPGDPEIEVLFGEDFELAIRMMLQGPFDHITELMKSNLHDNGHIPLGEPYGTGNGETTTQAVLDEDSVDSDIIVDWVLVELRRTATQVSKVRAALLQKDGDIVDTDGVSPVKFSGVASGKYHVAVKHRNHLGAMTKVQVILGDLSQ